MPNIRVMHFGLGPIGAAILKQISTRSGFKVVGGVDVDPAKIGRDLGDVAGLSSRLGIKVSSDAARTLKSSKPDIVVLCTSSSLKKVLPQIEMILKSKTPIVSTTEELAYPGYTHIRPARQIHAWAKKAKVAVLSTGVNPGFVMDALPIALTAVCARVDRVVVNRIQDARVRRLPFQQKIGAGMTTEQFQKQVDEGTVIHVGFTESIAMIADALGWKLDRIAALEKSILRVALYELRHRDDIPDEVAIDEAVTLAKGYCGADAPGFVNGILGAAARAETA